MIYKLLLLAAAITAVVGKPVTGARLRRRGALPEPVSADEALSLLDDLSVRTESNSPAYKRTEFGSGWITISKGCDTRETLLKRDGDNVKTSSDCKATSGHWYSDYDGEEFTDPGELDIDHVVPLKEAWVSGASKWTRDDRVAFANDLERPQLLAVSLTSNRQKGDKDPAEWIPPLEDFQCTYVQAYVEVKSHYELSVDQDEKDAIIGVLENCGGSRSGGTKTTTSAGSSPTQTQRSSATLASPITKMTIIYALLTMLFFL